MTYRRVVVTGLGLISPVGNDVNSSWNNIIQGQSGVKPITAFDVADFETKFAATVEIDIEAILDKKEVRRTDPFIQYGLIASKECLEDSQIDLENTDLNRFGVSIGSGIGGLGTIEENKIKLSETSPKKISPFFVPGAIANMVSGYASLKYGLKGPNISIASACSSASHSIGYSFRSIAHGDADLILTGGAEMATTPLGLAGFNAAKALSTNNENPYGASRPWDRDRDGFVLGEGAGAIVLEEYEHAKARGAHIYAEVIGGGMSSDAHHMTAPHPEGIGVIAVMKNCLENSGIQPEDVDHINTHGTSTPLGDVAELKAISNVFGEHAKNININSTKSMTGHLLGAAGAIESIASILAMKHGIVPPTINHSNSDENINSDLNLTLNKAQKRDIKVAMSNTFGFGGHNACVAFRKID